MNKHYDGGDIVILFLKFGVIIEIISKMYNFYYFTMLELYEVVHYGQGCYHVSDEW